MATLALVGTRGVADPSQGPAPPVPVSLFSHPRAGTGTPTPTTHVPKMHDLPSPNLSSACIGISLACMQSLWCVCSPAEGTYKSMSMSGTGPCSACAICGPGKYRYGCGGLNGNYCSSNNLPNCRSSSGGCQGCGAGTYKPAWLNANTACETCPTGKWAPAPVGVSSAGATQCTGEG